MSESGGQMVPPMWLMDSYKADFRIVPLIRSRKIRNFMPEVVLFPRLKRAENWLRHTHHRMLDAKQAWQHGIPDYDEDW